MADYRRAARELALRCLYQADVGRQSMRQAVTGAVEQLAASVRSGLIMAVRQAERRLKEEHDPPNVVVSLSLRRERRRVHGHVSRQLNQCVQVLTELVESVVATSPTASVEEALERFPEMIRPFALCLERVLSGCALPPKEREYVEETIRDAFATMRRTFEKRLPVARETADMLLRLAIGAWRHREDADERLRALTEDWPLERQSAADRNILRLGAFELLHCPDTPPAVVLNEAVELAKRYGSDESSKFVNGVLAALAAQVGLVTQDPAS